MISKKKKKCGENNNNKKKKENEQLNLQQFILLCIQRYEQNYIIKNQTLFQTSL